MCKMKDVNLGIKDLNFTAHRGKMLARLTDGREVLIPVSFFPDIQHMPVKERELGGYRIPSVPLHGIKGLYRHYDKALRQHRCLCADG